MTTSSLRFASSPSGPSARPKKIDRQSAVKTSQRINNDGIPFTLAFHPRNHVVKFIFLKNLKLFQNHPDTGRTSSRPLLITFKGNKNWVTFQQEVHSKQVIDHQPGTFKCARTRCKTSPFIQKISENNGIIQRISGPKRSIKITDHFTCASTNVIYCITCILCKKLYIGESGRRVGDLFREHQRDLKKDDKNAFKPVMRRFNFPNHSKQHMAVCGLSLRQGSMESRETLEQFFFQIGTLNTHGINKCFSFS